MAGAERHHTDQAGRDHRAGLLQVSAVPGLLLPHVPGHRALRGHTRPHLPARHAQLYW